MYHTTVDFGTSSSCVNLRFADLFTLDCDACEAGMFFTETCLTSPSKSSTTPALERPPSNHQSLPKLCVKDKRLKILRLKQELNKIDTNRLMVKNIALLLATMVLPIKYPKSITRYALYTNVAMGRGKIKKNPKIQKDIVDVFHIYNESPRMYPYDEDEEGDVS